MEMMRGIGKRKGEPMLELGFSWGRGAGVGGGQHFTPIFITYFFLVT